MANEKLPGFGARLHELRNAAGMTQDELAKATGINRQVVANLECGFRSPSLAIALRLADALGVGIEVLSRGAFDEVDRPRKKGRPPA